MKRRGGRRRTWRRCRAAMRAAPLHPVHARQPEQTRVGGTWTRSHSVHREPTNANFHASDRARGRRRASGSGRRGVSGRALRASRRSRTGPRAVLELRAHRVGGATAWQCAGCSEDHCVAPSAALMSRIVSSGRRGRDVGQARCRCPRRAVAVAAARRTRPANCLRASRPCARGATRRPRGEAARVSRRRAHGSPRPGSAAGMPRARTAPPHLTRLLARDRSDEELGGGRVCRAARPIGSLPFPHRNAALRRRVRSSADPGLPVRTSPLTASPPPCIASRCPNRARAEPASVDREPVAVEVEAAWIALAFVLRGTPARWSRSRSTPAAPRRERPTRCLDASVVEVLVVGGDRPGPLRAAPSLPSAAASSARARRWRGRYAP